MKDWKLAAGLITMAVLMAGCAAITSGDASREANLGEIVDLEEGGRVALNGTGLTVTFLEVTADSRCPADAICSEAGVVTGLFGVDAGDGVSEQIEITLIGRGPETAEAGGYRIELREINPYPTSQSDPATTDYTASIAVTDGSTLPSGTQTPGDADPTTAASQGTDEPQPNESGEAAVLGEPFRIFVGEAVTPAGSDLAITLLEVQDSRCPTDVECATAGQVTLVFEIISEGSEEQFDLTLNTNQPAATEALDHEITLFEVEPYPSSAANPPQQGNYAALIQVD